MKKNIYLLYCLVFFAGARTSAASINVTTATIASALSSATDGDTLLLAPGTYATAFGIQNGKILTIKSDGTGTVKLTPQLSASAGNTGGGLIFDGVTIDRTGASTYFFNGEVGKVDIIAFRNCTIQNIGRSLVRCDNTNDNGKIMSDLEISDCIIQNCGADGYAFLRINHNLTNVNISNNTFNNYKGEDIFFSNSATVNASSTNFLFKNNTVYKSIRTGTRAICNANNKFNSTSSYTFKNNILNLNSEANAKPYLLTGAASGSVLIAEKNLIVDFIGTNTTAYNLAGATSTDLTLAGLGLSSIGFEDPDNGNFNILSTSPVATASTTSGILGDPRWLKVVTQPANLITSLSAIGAGSISPASGTFNVGEQITLTATNKFGYHFKEWQDANTGDVLSVNNPYTFTIDADISVKAVYNAAVTYNFTVNTVGSDWGIVELIPKPVNGKYEAGTEVTITVVPNAVTTFSYWEDNSTILSRTVTVNSDLNFTATFDEIPFIVGWDFREANPTNSRLGDYYSASDKRGTISVYSGVTNNTVGWLSNAGISSPSYPNLRLWTPSAEFNANIRRYLQAQFSTEGYKNIQVKSMVSGSNQGYSVYKLQYSIDGAIFTDVSGATVNIGNGSGGYKSTWSDLNATLPAEAEGKTVIYLRWIADATSAKIDPNTNNPGTDVEGTAYTNIFIYADKEIENDTENPILLSSVPLSNSNTATINGSIVLTFDERVKAGAGDITLGGKLLTGIFGAKTVTFTYEKLNYGVEYTLIIPGGALTDLSGNPFAPYTLTFKTAEKAEPVKKLFDAVVAKDGSGDYISVIEAIANAPANRTIPWVIFIKNGSYSGHHEIPSNKPFIHLIGQSRNGVIITDNIGTDTNPSWEQGSTMYVQGANCYFENIIFQNEFGYIGKQGPPALAFYTKGDRFSMKNTYLRSFQDTYFTGNVSTNRCYIQNSRIEGAVDYIYGNGNVFFDRDTLTNVRKGSVIVAPDHSPETVYGYVFRNCIINEDPTLTEKGDHAFGRPWKGTPKTVFINTKLLADIKPAGWNDMGVAAEIFADYGTVDKNGNPVDVSQRKSQYFRDGNYLGTAKNSLTDVEAASYTYENVILRSGDSWDPRLMCEAPEKPNNLKLLGNNLTWDNTTYTRLYVIIRNGEVVGFPLTNEFTDITAQLGTNYTYKVLAVGEFGALSTESEIVQTLPITGLKLKAVIGGQSIQLNWNTLTEKGTSHFVIERTIDGKNFEELGSIKAVGNSNTNQAYYFTDHTPLAETNIYRIKAIDFDGHIEYSDLVSVRFVNNVNIGVYPNPAAEYIKVFSPVSKNNISIYDMTGKKVFTARQVENNQNLNISGLPVGIYIVEVNNGKGNYHVTRLLKE